MAKKSGMVLEAYISGKCGTPRFHDERDSVAASITVTDANHVRFIKGELFDPAQGLYGDKRPFCHLDHLADMASDFEDAGLIAFCSAAGQFTDYVHMKEIK